MSGDGAEKGARDYLAVLVRRRWTAALAGGAFFGVLASYAHFSTPVYRGASLVNIEKPGDLVVGAVAERLSSQPQDEEYFSTQAKLIVSDTALRKAYEDLQLARTEEFGSGVRRLRGAVSVLAVPKTRLVFVNADSRDPRLAVAISTTLAQNFVQANLDNQLFMSKNALAALETRAKGSEATKVYEALPAVVRNSLIQGLKADIVRAEAALAGLAAKFRDEHPAVIAARSQLALMRAARDREVQNVVRSLRTELSGQLRPNNVRIVDEARLPDAPVRPRKNLALVLGIVGGLIAGVLSALGLETLDVTVRGRGDLERVLGLRCLGQIQDGPRRRGEKIYAALVAPQASASGEAFRNLRTMVSLTASGAGRAVLITSAVEEEGKSFVAANLAVAVAQLGQRVLLIDGDLRRPSQHLNLGVEEDHPGLCDFLSGAVESPEAVVQPTEAPGLFLAACGVRPVNPAELLHDPRLARFIGWARGRYDRVIVDCPPLSPVSDALLWGRHIPSAIVVARYGRTPLPELRSACERLRCGGVTVVGGVLNGVLGAADERYYRRAA